MKVLSILLHLIIFLILYYVGAKIRVHFKVSCLKQDNTILTQAVIQHLKVVCLVQLN